MWPFSETDIIWPNKINNSLPYDCGKGTWPVGDLLKNRSIGRHGVLWGYRGRGLPSDNLPIFTPGKVPGSLYLGIIIFGTSADFFGENSLNFLEKHLQFTPPRPQCPADTLQMPLICPTDVQQLPLREKESSEYRGVDPHMPGFAQVATLTVKLNHDHDIDDQMEVHQALRCPGTCHTARFLFMGWGLGEIWQGALRQ